MRAGQSSIGADFGISGLDILPGPVRTCRATRFCEDSASFMEGLPKVTNRSASPSYLSEVRCHARPTEHLSIPLIRELDPPRGIQPMGGA
jgi:hypothetical protein